MSYVGVSLENIKHVHLVLDENTVENLLALLWDYEDFNQSDTLYSKITKQVNIRRKNTDEVTTTSGKYTFYKILEG